MTKGFPPAKALKTSLLGAVLPGLVAGQLFNIELLAAEQRSARNNFVSDAESLEDPARELLQALSDRASTEKAILKSALATHQVSEPRAVVTVKEPAKVASLNREKVAPAPVAQAAVAREEVASQPVAANPDPAVEALRKELRSALSRVQVLERDLDHARTQLSMAETEVSRLSAIVDSHNRASLGKYSVPAPAPQPARVAPVAQPVAPAVPRSPRPRSHDVAPPSAHASLKVATISVEKADLRLGPGKNHSALMSVPKGSRLVVEARQGEWYRVFAPNGERAWVSASLVTFGDGASSLNDGSSVRVRGFDSNMEEEAFRRVQKITAGQ